MGYFDKNIHMNGAGTTYQAFLDLAEAAERKGGTIGNRTVRLVKDGDGLATTTSHGTKGARADQISGARDAFLRAIAREFGYAARDIAAKTLGDGKVPVPLTARSIRAVNQALGDKNALAADSALIRESKMDFDIEVAAARSLLASRMGATDAEVDHGKIQAEVLKLVRAGKYSNDNAGMRAAVREVAAQRVAVAVRMESLFRARGVPAHLAPRLAEKVLDRAMAIVDDHTLRNGKDVIGKLNALATAATGENQDVFDRDAIAGATIAEAENLLATMFGPNALEDEDAAKALDDLKAQIDTLQTEKKTVKAFDAECASALKSTVKTHIVRQIAMDMAMVDSDNPAYGRIGARFYDALGFGKGENDRAVTDYALWKLPPETITGRFGGANPKTPEELRGQAAKFVFTAIAEDYLKTLPPLADAHPHMAIAKGGVVRKVAADLLPRFETAVTDEDFAKLADDFKTQIARQLDRTNATLKNLDPAVDQAKAELEGRLGQLAGQYGIPLTQGIRDMLSKTLAEATAKMKLNSTGVEKALSVDECKEAILVRIEQKWLAPCRQAAAEIDASALDPAQKKAFLAKLMENTVEVAHVKMALKTVPAFDAKELVGTAKAGDGKKFVEQFFQFVSKTNASITDKAERDTIAGADDYSAFMGTAADLLFVLNPDIGEAVRGLDVETRGKLFEDAEQTSTDKSREIQAIVQRGIDPQQARVVAMEARSWSAANACVMQLQEAIG